jgi:hypothetical protein
MVLDVLDVLVVVALLPPVPLDVPDALVVAAPPLPVPSVEPLEPVSTLPPQPAATSRPRRTAPAVRGTVPSSRRSGAPHWGHAEAEGRAWQLHEGQAMSVW